MGAPMARNMAAAGLEVRAWNRTREKAEALRSQGVSVGATPAEAARGADAVVTMVSDGSAVETTVSGESGALAGMGADAVWLQTSTVGLSATERLAELASDRGVAFVDGPVLGTKQPAERGELIVLASGPDEAREHCGPVFEAIAAKTMWLGQAGAGTRMKLVLNSWLLALVASLAETVALAEASGVDPATFLDVIRGSPFGLPYADVKGRPMVDRSFDPSFPLRLAEKDAALVLEAAERFGLEPAMQRTARESFARALREGHGEEDMAAVYRAVNRTGASPDGGSLDSAT